MIECTYPILAVYQSDTEKTATEVPVLAWNDAGEAFILGDKALILASTAAGFQGLRMQGEGRKRDPRVPDPVVIPPRVPRTKDER